MATRCLQSPTNLFNEEEDEEHQLFDSNSNSKLMRTQEEVRHLLIELSVLIRHVRSNHRTMVGCCGSVSPHHRSTVGLHYLLDSTEWSPTPTKSWTFRSPSWKFNFDNGSEGVTTAAVAILFIYFISIKYNEILFVCTAWSSSMLLLFVQTDVVANVACFVCLFCWWWKKTLRKTLQQTF